MLPVATLRAVVTANTTEATASLTRFNAALKETAARADATTAQISRSATRAGSAYAAAGTKMTAAGKVLTKAVTMPLLAIGGAAVYSAVTFKRQMGLIATDAGGSAKEVARLEHSVLGLARASQFGPTQLAESLFHVESSGYRGAKAMKVLNEAQKLATTGNSDLQTTTYALVSATKALYGESLKNVNRTAAELNGIVAHGDMRLEELTSAMATGVIPKARAMGLELRDVGAAMDVMTARGIPAQRAAYALGFTMQKLIPATEKAQEAFASIGLGEEELVNMAQHGRFGYVSALEDLQRHLDQLPTKAQQTKVIEEMFGGGRMTSGLLTNLQNLGEMKKIYGELGDEVKKYNHHVKEAEHQPLVELKKAWSSIQADLTEVGAELIPIVVPAFKDIAGFVGGIAHDFEKLSPEAQSWIIKIGFIGAALGPVLTIGGNLLKVFSGMATATKATATWLGIIDTETAAAGTGGTVAAGEGAAGATVGALGGAEAGAVGLSALSTIALPVGIGVGLAALTAAVMNTGSAFEDAHKHFNEVASDLEHKSIPAWKKTREAVAAVRGEFGQTERNSGLRALESHKQWGLQGTLLPHAAGQEKLSKEDMHKALQPLREAEEAFSFALARINLDQLAGLGKLNADLKGALGEAGNAWKTGTTPWRTHVVEAMQQTVHAIEFGMQNGSIKAGEGRKEIDRILGEIKLVKGSDPLGLAQGIVSSFKQAGTVTQHGINELLTDFKQMPKGAREQSQDAVLAMANEWAKGHPKIEHQVSVLRHNLEHEFGQTKTAARRKWHEMTGGMSTDFGNLADSVGTSAEAIQGTVNSMLKGLNVGKVINFSINHGNFSAAGIGKQRGGPINVGALHGDSVPAVLERGEYVLNRKAVDAVGRHNLDAVNFGSAPRFQKGGGIGPEPHLSGPAGTLRSIGQGAVHEMYGAAKHFIAKHTPHGGLFAGKTPAGVGSFDGMPVDKWIIPILAWASKHGWAGTVTSGYRSEAEQAELYANRGSNPNPVAPPGSSNHEKVAYPGGAVDVTLPEVLVHVLKRYPRRPNLVWGPEGGNDDPVHFSATGHQLGGIVGMSTGGPVPPAKGELVGASYYGGSTDTVSNPTYGAWGPDHPFAGHYSFAELAMGHALGGLPFGTKLKISRGGHSVIAEKFDVGDGGEDVAGKNRAIDLHYETAAKVGIGPSNGLAVVRVQPASGSAISGGSTKENVPATFHGARTKSLSFPSTPKTLSRVEAEIQRWQSELHTYRTAAKAANGMPKTQRAIQANVKAIETHLRTLHNARAKMRREIAKKHFSHRAHKALNKVTGFEQTIEGKERDYNKASQYAEQLVALEPQLPEFPESMSEAQRAVSEGTFAAAYKLYVENRERPAYMNVLATEADWRNTTLAAEGRATGLETAWEARIRQIDAKIAQINAYTNSHDAKYWHAHPKELKHREELRNELPMLRFKEQELRKVLGEARTSFYGGELVFDENGRPTSPLHPPAVPLPGTGEYEQNLETIQGVHWPGQHEHLGPGALAPPRRAGRFGGAIWDTQGAIEELGLKSLGISGGGAGGGSGESNEGKEALYRELLTQANQRELVRLAQAGVKAPYAGPYAAGGIVSALVGERGPELATFPTGTRITPANETAQMLSPKVEVHIYEGEGRAEVKIDDEVIDAAIQRHDRRTARGANRGLARAGVGLR